LLKYKLIKKINSFALKILFCSYSLSGFAGESDIKELELAKQEKYIFNSLNSFFQAKTEDSETTVNRIVSPYGLEGCLATYGKTQCTPSEAKNDFDNRLIKLGINPNMPLSSKKEDQLQLLTAILTRDEVNSKATSTLKDIFIGEHLLQQDNNDIIKNYRKSFQEKIQNALAEKFNSGLNLDYKEFWSPAPVYSNTYLKVVSAIKFQDDWYGKPFDSLGLRDFYTKDNKKIQTDFIEKTVITTFAIDNTSNWQAIRIFYKHNYFIDIILPAENDKTTDENKKQIICSLISELNQNKDNSRQEINIFMPKFEHKQKNCLNYYTQQLLVNFKPDYKDFLKDPNFIDSASIYQDCYIKIDEAGTTAEAITSLTATDGCSMSKNFIVNRSYFFVLSEYNEVHTSNDPFEIKNIIMIGEVGNPSEQLIVPK
jgi:hypothetical protein